MIHSKKALALLIFLVSQIAAFTQEVKLGIPDGPKRMSSINFSPDGSLLTIASWDNTIKVFDVSLGLMLYSINDNTSSVQSTKFSTDGSRIVTASNDGTAKIFDITTGKLIRSLDAELISGKNCAEFSPDGNQVIVSSERYNRIKVFNSLSGELLRTIETQKGPNSLQYSADGRYILSKEENGIANIYDASNGNLLHSLNIHTSEWISTVKISPVRYINIVYKVIETSFTLFK